MNTLIINLTRFGDLLQTQPVISGLTARGHRVSLVCLENFAPATAMLRHVEAVYPLPGARLLSLMESGWHGGLSELWQWSRTVRSNAAPRTVLNLTASLSVRLLARHLTGADAQLHGFALDSEGFGHNTDPWSTFLQASTRMRGCSPFNIIDLFRMSAGLDGTQCPFELNSPADSVREAMNSTLQAHTGNLLRSGAMRHPPRGFVALQPGASEERRRWPVEHFARTGDMLWQSHGLCPVLLGSGAEAELGRRYAAAATAPHINLIGATDLPSLGAALLAARLLISNDTGTMHLAAGLGVPVLAIFLATAQPWDTGPYKEGMCSLEPDLPCHPCPFNSRCPHEHICRRHIQPATVHAMTARWLDTGVWSAQPEEKDARVWISRLRSDGFLDLESLSGHENTDRTVWVRLQRHFYSQFLDRAPAARFGTGAVRTINEPEQLLKPENDTLQAALDELAQADALLHLLQEQGNALRHRSVEMLKKRFLATWQKLQVLWDASPRFNVLGFLWMSETQEAGACLDTVLALAARYRTLITTWRTHLLREGI